MKVKIILSILLLALVIAVSGSIVYIVKTDPGLLSMSTTNIKSILFIFGISLVLEVILTVTAVGLALFEGLVMVSEALAWRKPYVRG